MSSINYATFSGSIARNSIRQGVSGNGKAWARFTIVTTSSTYDKATGTYTKEPNFYCNCVVFGNLATTIEPVLQEGANLLVSGHFSTEGYEAKDGSTGINYQLMCENVAVNCVPWQTISVHVNNNNASASAQTPTTPQPTVSQQQQSAGGSNAWNNYPTTGTQPMSTSNAWNNIPTTATQPYSGAAALGVSDEPGF